jgi:monovalent cation:H+ antiporter-2, CPA2 family
LGIAADFVLIILAGLIGGVAARVLRLALMVGYVAAGILVGPHTAGPTVVQIHEIELLAEIGVALLLFSLSVSSFRSPTSNRSAVSP